MTTLIFLQHYWWFIISLLGALLVLMLFVQGGQSLIYELSATPDDKNMLVNSLGRKWEITFTTLVTFGGAFFASFPLFYSTSFGGAFYVWMLILLVFVIQAVAYEFRRKPGNIFGAKTYERFLLVNGLLGPMLLGMALGTFFTGAPFTVDRLNIAGAGNPVISQWATPWHGLEVFADCTNWLLGLTLVFLSRTLATHYFLSNVDDGAMRQRVADISIYNVLPLVFFVLVFLGTMVWGKGASYGFEEPYYITSEDFRYLHNFIEMPYLVVMIAAGLGLIIGGSYLAWRRLDRRAIWFSGSGTVLVVLALMLSVGWNKTCYYVSTVDVQSSLNIANSSSSEFTLRVMSWVSLFIPFVAVYIWYVWRIMDRKPITKAEIAGDEHAY